MAQLPDDWDFWNDDAGLRCVGYDSQTDADLIAVYEGVAAKKFNTEIAAGLGLPTQYVGLLQEILCSANWADYGTSPRGCWPNLDHDADAQLEKLKAWFLNKWDEPYRAAENP